MSETRDATLVGLWEQVGMLNSAGAVVPWSEGSLNASVREFFRFAADGTFVFGRFFYGANVTFDEAADTFVTDGNWEEIHRGRWVLDGMTLRERFESDPLTVRSVELGEVSPERFVVNERTPLPRFVLRVVYRRVGATGDPYAQEGNRHA